LGDARPLHRYYNRIKDDQKMGEEPKKYGVRKIMKMGIASLRNGS
jgi:hypothetical protein